MARSGLSRGAQFDLPGRAIQSPRYVTKDASGARNERRVGDGALSRSQECGHYACSDGVRLVCSRHWGGDRKKARELANQIGRINPARGYLAQAKLSEPTGERGVSEAEALLKKAAEAWPRDYNTRLALAEFYRGSAKNYASAEQEAKVAIMLAPDQSRAYADLVVVYAHGQKWEELDELLAQAEKAVPDDLNPFYQARENSARGRTRLQSRGALSTQVSKPGARGKCTDTR